MLGTTAARGSLHLAAILASNNRSLLDGSLTGLSLKKQQPLVSQLLLLLSQLLLLVSPVLAVAFIVCLLQLPLSLLDLPLHCSDLLLQLDKLRLHVHSVKPIEKELLSGSRG